MLQGFLQKNLPGHEVVHVTVDYASGTWRKSEDTSAELAEKIQKSLRVDDRITHLVLNSHGYYWRSNDESSSGTILRGMGWFSEDDASAAFEQIIEALRGRVDGELTVAMDACLTFCGTYTEVGRRARYLLSRLGVPNGAVYGASSREVFVPSNYGDARASDDALARFTQFRLALVAALAIPFRTRIGENRALMEVLRMQYESLTTLSETKNRGAIAAILRDLLRMQYDALFSLFKPKNRGRIAVIRNGQLDSIIEVSRRDAQLQIYGVPTCSAALDGR